MPISGQGAASGGGVDMLLAPSKQASDDWCGVWCVEGKHYYATAKWREAGRGVWELLLLHTTMNRSKNCDLVVLRIIAMHEMIQMKGLVCCEWNSFLELVANQNAFL